MPKPTCQRDLQRFIGIVLYMRSKFISHLSDLLKPLRDLSNMKEVTHLKEYWTKFHDEAFEKVKNCIVDSTLLQYYNVGNPVIVQCDASQFGLGSVLLQKGKHVSFASRTLSNSKIYYCQLEKECLAVYFAFHRFHQYLAGKHDITVQTDHKPLEVIFKKPLLSVPKRLQSMILK